MRTKPSGIRLGGRDDNVSAARTGASILFGNRRIANRSIYRTRHAPPNITRSSPFAAWCSFEDHQRGGMPSASLRTGIDLLKKERFSPPQALKLGQSWATTHNNEGRHPSSPQESRNRKVDGNNEDGGMLIGAGNSRSHSEVKILVAFESKAFAQEEERKIKISRENCSASGEKHLLREKRGPLLRSPCAESGGERLDGESQRLAMILAGNGALEIVAGEKGTIGRTTMRKDPSGTASCPAGEDRP